MTQQEQQLADDKMRAEIAKLIAETSKNNQEFAWVPCLSLSGAIAVTATIVKLFF